MRILSGSVLLASAIVLAACGSHQHSAPVVYGAAPASSGRIYNSSQEIAAERQRAVQANYTPAAYAPARLTPVTPVTQTSNAGGRFDYDAKPVYIAQTQPVYRDPPRADLPGQVTVLPGDTVYAVARRTGASPQSIISLNRLSPPYILTIGESLRVPSSAVPPSGGQPSGVTQASAKPYAARDGVHVVRAGDTLFSISRAANVDVATIAHANHLRAPYTISIGQSLRIPGAVTTRNDARPPREREAALSGDVADLARTVSYNTPDPAPVKKFFDWPVKGAVIGSYGLSSTGKRNDGVNIAAPVGTPVRAAADGDVVYRGSELDGYGNLLLIKHDDGFVTAYAHNDVMLVKKGDRVRQGQVIAKVGQTGSASEPQLHFEIRQNLKAIDPVALLGSL